jgi:hypothetical protein
MKNRHRIGSDLSYVLGCIPEQDVGGFHSVLLEAAEDGGAEGLFEALLQLEFIDAGLGGELKCLSLAFEPVVPVGGGACQAEGEIHRGASYLKVNGGVGEADTVVVICQEGLFLGGEGMHHAIDG